MRTSLFTSLALGIALVLVSCRTHRGPDGELGERIDETRERLQDLRESHSASRDDIEQLRMQTQVGLLEAEMFRDFGVKNYPPRFFETPPDDTLPPAEYIETSMTFQLKRQEALDELWLAGGVADAHPDVDEAVMGGRRMIEEWLGSYERQNGRPYWYTKEQQEYVRHVVALRGQQLLTETCNHCREFLQGSRAWWEGRGVAPSEAPAR